jgi:hypothetical protein
LRVFRICSRDGRALVLFSKRSVDLRALLNPEKGLIFRITHIDNVPWILEHGLHCRSSGILDPQFRDIGDPDLIRKRAPREVPVPPGGTLSDHIAFYFAPLSPMLLKIKTGHGGVKQVPMPEIAILVSSVPRLAELGLPFVLTDRHAYLQAAQYSSDLAGLARVDWKTLQTRDFKIDPDDPGKKERYQAEALVHGHVPVEALVGVVCHGLEERTKLDAVLTRTKASLKLAAIREWFF